MEPIAIVGLSYKLPEGDNEDHSFWDNLQRGRSLSRPWPKSRGNIDAFYSSNVAMDNTVSYIHETSREQQMLMEVDRYTPRMLTLSKKILPPLMQPSSP